MGQLEGAHVLVQLTQCYSSVIWCKCDHILKAVRKLIRKDSTLISYKGLSLMPLVLISQINLLEHLKALHVPNLRL